MRFQVKTGGLTTLKTSCLLLPVYASGPLAAACRPINVATGGLVADLVDGGDIRGKVGDTLLVHPGSGIAADRIMLVGCGEKDKFDRKQYRKALQAAYAALARTRHTDAISCLHLEAVKGANVVRRALIAAQTWQNASYRYTLTKPAADNVTPAIDSLDLVANPGKAADTRKGLKQGAAIGLGMALSRELGNLPANVCTPSHLAAEAKKIARGNDKLKVEILSEADMKKSGMGAFLSVTAGTVEPAKLIVIRYSGAAKTKSPIALVGKGVTFDSW